jgi:hypothetical protein
LALALGLGLLRRLGLLRLGRLRWRLAPGCAGPGALLRGALLRVTLALRALGALLIRALPALRAPARSRWPSHAPALAAVRALLRARCCASRWPFARSARRLLRSRCWCALCASLAFAAPRPPLLPRAAGCARLRVTLAFARSSSALLLLAPWFAARSRCCASRCCASRCWRVPRVAALALLGVALLGSRCWARAAELRGPGLRRRLRGQALRRDGTRPAPVRRLRRQRLGRRHVGAAILPRRRAACARCPAARRGRGLAAIRSAPA